MGDDDEARRKRAAERLAGRLQAVGVGRPARPAAPGGTDAARGQHSPAGAVAALRRSLADSAARTDRRRPSRTFEAAAPESQQHVSPAGDMGSGADNPELEARQAEHAERWGDAARAWAKASDARPDQEALARRAALNFLKDGHQLSLGVEYAQRAVQLAPGDAFSHRVLGQLYLEARMWQNAKSALEQALALNPEDSAVHVLIQKAKRHA